MNEIEIAKRWNPAARRLLWAAVAAFAAFLQPAASAEEEDRPTIVVPRVSGRELFQNCVLCHKYDGRGGPSEGGYAADLRKTELSVEGVATIITYGRPGKGMPPFAGMLDEFKINTLAKFVKEELKLKE